MAYRRVAIDRVCRPLIVATLLASSVGAFASRASAQVTVHDTAAADALFEEGRKLMGQGRVRDACTKFKESLDRAPGLGTQLNLADCYERLGLTATAWTTFKEVEAGAKSAGKADRERTARDRAKNLEPKLGKLVFIFAEKLDKTGEVKRDGTVIDSSELSGPLPTDPGLHKIEVSQKGRKPYSMTVELAQGPVQQKVEVPKLELDGSAAAADTTKPGIPGDNKEVRYSASVPESGGRSPLKTIGLITAGAGIVTLGVGAYFGVRTYSLWKNVLDTCDPTACTDANARAQGDDARSSGNIATIAFVAGGVLTAGGVVMFLVAPSSSATTEAKTRFVPVLGGNQLGARWEGRF